MQQVHGPYRLTAGQHTEDVPSLGADGKPIKFKVKAVADGAIETTDGGSFQLGNNGVTLFHEGRQHSCYRANQRVMASALKPGNEVELCHEVTYGAGSTPAKFRRADVLYEPFMSSKPLDEMHNRPNAIKFLRTTGKAQADEIAKLRQQIAEMTPLTKTAKK